MCSYQTPNNLPRGAGWAVEPLGSYMAVLSVREDVAESIDAECTRVEETQDLKTVYLSIEDGTPTVG